MSDSIYVVKDKGGEFLYSHTCYETMRVNAENSDVIFPSSAPHTIHEYIPAPQWVPVSERLPEPDTPVLVWLSGDAEPRFDVDYVDVCPEYGHEFFSNYDGEVTHWYLPAPPEEQE